MDCKRRIPFLKKLVFYRFIHISCSKIIVTHITIFTAVLYILIILIKYDYIVIIVCIWFIYIYFLVVVFMNNRKYICYISESMIFIRGDICFIYFLYLINYNHLYEYLLYLYHSLRNLGMCVLLFFTDWINVSSMKYC